MDGRFVILVHDYPSLHWDFLLETGDAAATWRLSDCPASGRIIDAERIEDHRLLYLNYEGPVSGGRGRVSRVFSGRWAGQLGENQGRIDLAQCDAFTSASLSDGGDGALTWTFS